MLIFVSYHVHMTCIWADLMSGVGDGGGDSQASRLLSEKPLFEMMFQHSQAGSHGIFLMRRSQNLAAIFMSTQLDIICPSGGPKTRCLKEKYAQKWKFSLHPLIHALIESQIKLRQKCYSSPENPTTQRQQNASTGFSFLGWAFPVTKWP